MPRTVSIECECGVTCRSKSHAYDLNSAITKGTLREIKAYFRLCHRAGRSSDMLGRTALHVASACGKTDVVKWLLAKNYGDVRTRDKESGWTALHRAVFYGQLECARFLISSNSSLTVRDYAELTPLDHLRMDFPYLNTLSLSDPTEVYSWGHNSNFTLGHATEKGRDVPEVIDVLRRDVGITQIAMNKYHSVFVSRDGSVYSCGLGQGGRLGHSHQQTCVTPTKVKSISSHPISQVALSIDHTILLSRRGHVYSCGTNDFCQLGHLSPEKQFLHPKKIVGQTWGSDEVVSVATARYHTVVCTDYDVYTFGLNAGQLGLGHTKGKPLQQIARRVSAVDKQSPVLVSCSDAATVCLCYHGAIFLSHDYTCRKIWNQRSIRKLRVTGGHLDAAILKHRQTDLVIVMLDTTGSVFVWRQGYMQSNICAWSINREIPCSDFALSTSSLMLLAKEGNVFMGHFTRGKHFDPISPAPQ